MPARALLRLRDMREEPQVEVLGDGPAPGLVIRHVVWLLMYRFGAAVVSTVARPARLVDSFPLLGCGPAYPWRFPLSGPDCFNKEDKPFRSGVVAPSPPFLVISWCPDGPLRRLAALGERGRT